MRVRRFDFDPKADLYSLSFIFAEARSDCLLKLRATLLFSQACPAGHAPAAFPSVAQQELQAPAWRADGLCTRC